jgi:hypothetical protein
MFQDQTGAPIVSDPGRGQGEAGLRQRFAVRSENSIASLQSMIWYEERTVLTALFDVDDWFF